MDSRQVYALRRRHSSNLYHIAAAKSLLRSYEGLKRAGALADQINQPPGCRWNCGPPFRRSRRRPSAIRRLTMSCNPHGPENRLQGKNKSSLSPSVLLIAGGNSPSIQLTAVSQLRTPSRNRPRVPSVNITPLIPVNHRPCAAILSGPRLLLRLGRACHREQGALRKPHGL